MSYDSQRLASFKTRAAQRANEYGSTDPVLDVYVQPSGEDEYGNINEASLLLRGKIIEARIKSEEARPTNEPWRLETPDGFTAGLAYPDVENELSSTAAVWCLCIRTEPFGLRSTSRMASTRNVLLLQQTSALKMR
jgi:hypothetical protein